MARSTTERLAEKTVERQFLRRKAAPKSSQGFDLVAAGWLAKALARRNRLTLPDTDGRSSRHPCGPAWNGRLQGRGAQGNDRPPSRPARTRFREEPRTLRRSPVSNRPPHPAPASLCGSAFDSSPEVTAMIMNRELPRAYAPPPRLGLDVRPGHEPGIAAGHEGPRPALGSRSRPARGRSVAARSPPPRHRPTLLLCRGPARPALSELQRDHDRGRPGRRLPGQ